MHPTLTPAAAVATPAGGASSSPPSGLPLWAAVPAAIIGGLALSLASPPVGWWPLALLSVTLALITLVGRSIGGALLVGAEVRLQHRTARRTQGKKVLRCHREQQDRQVCASALHVHPPGCSQWGNHSCALLCTSVDVPK